MITKSLLTLIFICGGLASGEAQQPASRGNDREEDKATELPEFVVKQKKDLMLHLLGYVREYSTLSSYSDTLTLYRTKWVDYMIPVGSKRKYKGWHSPRVISSHSCYRFTDCHGLDSVSDRSPLHFSWGDWVGIVDAVPVPESLAFMPVDTIKGRYQAGEIWNRDTTTYTVDVNPLAVESARRWIPQFDLFFSDHTDFEQFKLSYEYRNVYDDILTPRDLSHMTYTLESRGRARNLFRFGKLGEPLYVNTRAEIYFVEKEYIIPSEARKWENLTLAEGDWDRVPLPADLPALDTQTAELVARVEAIDHVKVRSDIVIDKRYAGLSLKPLSKTESFFKKIRETFQEPRIVGANISVR